MNINMAIIFSYFLYNLLLLILWNTLVTIYTSSFNVKKLCILLIDGIYVFCIILSVNNDFSYQLP